MWRQHQTFDGRKFYFNQETHEKTWDRPVGYEDESPPTPPPTPPGEPDLPDPVVSALPVPVKRKYQAPVRLAEGEEAEFTSKVGGKVLVMKDAGLAASVALRDAFPVPVEESMCWTHTTVIWLPRHKTDFTDYEKNYVLMIQDLKKLKSLTVVGLVPIAKLLMVKKWRILYEEPAVAQLWINSWGDSAVTRVEANQFSILKGGAAADNNSQEG